MFANVFVQRTPVLNRGARRAQHPLGPSPNLDVGPDGGPTLERAIFLGGVGNFLPSEEALVDAQGAGALGATFFGSGALLGAFVPASQASNSGFLAKDEDFIGIVVGFTVGTPSDALFVIGGGQD